MRRFDRFGRRDDYGNHGAGVFGVSFDGEFDGLVSDGGLVSLAEHVCGFGEIG